MPAGIKRALPFAGVTAFALLAVLFPAASAQSMRALSAWFLRTFDWFTLLFVSAALIFCLVIAVSPVGKRVIGGEEAKPEFGVPTWIAMLFASGMGAGLVFWGAAEPLIHVVSPPPDGPLPNTPQAEYYGLAITQFHWAFHAWAVYALAALVVGVFAVGRVPPLPSAPFSSAPPWVAQAINWAALVAVIFGIVASVGQGVFQLVAGANRLTDGVISDGIGTNMIVLGMISVAYLASASTGLRRGIAWLSNINMVLAIALAGFVFVAADTPAILATLMKSIIGYADEFIPLSTDLRPEGEGRDWTRAWSLTYFLWWVAWAPFVGVFIARISRGRSLRVFVLGVVVLPSILTLLWFSIFGGAALSLHEQGIDLGVSDFATAPAAAYVILEHLPWTAAAQLLTLCLVFVFLVTSADSASYVLSMFSRGRLGEPPIQERLFWGIVIAALSAAALLSETGQDATRAYAVAGGVPLLFLLVTQAVAVVRRLASKRS